jgi:uncharacterized membrane protein (UPF0182 family)
VVSAAYGQQEASDQQDQDRAFYTFPSNVAMDRYQSGGKAQDTMVAARELTLDSLPASQRGWVDEHLKYTHGYGLVAAKGDAVRPDGSPDYIEQGFPAAGAALGDYEPRIYFGTGLPDYSIVGGAAKSAPAEFDYPDDKSPTLQQSTTYAGKGGVPVGSLLNKLLYAVKFQEPKIVLSSGVIKDSRIMYDRDPKQRVHAVAPWLTVDGATYPVAVNGRILWVVDGYTTTAAYPYSTTTQLNNVTKDSSSGTGTNPLGASKVNYVRNSVKATVDAYDGTVTLYAWDETDPILKTWMKAFPGAVKPRSAISPDLLAHVRYPQDLFKAQRDILGRYHVTTPTEFFGGTSFWTVPNDPTKDSPDGTPIQPPYYQTLQMPGQQAPSFSLTSTLVPAGRSNLAAFMAVDCDPGPDYGQIRVLELPTDTQVRSPEQVQNEFHDTFASALKDLRASSKLVEGNLLTLPVGGGLLYVEPVYGQSQPRSTANQSTYPVLENVLVAFGDRQAFESTLKQGLDEVFAGDSGASTGENPMARSTPGTTTPSPVTSGSPGDQLRQALNDASTAQQNAAAALAQKPPDWTAFGKYEQQVQDALNRAQAIENGPQAPK